MKKRKSIEPAEFLDSQQFLDSISVVEKDTVPIEFYGDPRMVKSYTCDVEEDKETGDYFITIPEEVLSSLQWQAGDIIVWEVVDQNTVILTKK